MREHSDRSFMRGKQSTKESAHLSFIQNSTIWELYSRLSKVPQNSFKILIIVIRFMNVVSQIECGESIPFDDSDKAENFMR